MAGFLLGSGSVVPSEPAGLEAEDMSRAVAGAGAHLEPEEGDEDSNASQLLGEHRTESEATYEALLLGIELARRERITRLEVQLSSHVITTQLSGRWKAQNPTLAALHERALHALKDAGIQATFHNVSRAQNRDAIELAKKAAHTGVPAASNNSPQPLTQ